ncbi:hypothetical protein PQX77_007979 [Marasmius sp. AFHP31]|nr:hypothetical protein PQX77_007979 [Marasmius sp. AFHP31]
MFSHFFQNARNFRITGGSFVQGDQIHNTTTIVQAKEKERTELDEYFDVKRGAIYRVRHNGTYSYPRRWDNGDRYSLEVGRPRADRTIHAAELVDRPGKIFTVVEYTGPEAKKAFEDDFAMLMRNLRFNAAQMYGYNLSAIPSILLYNELVPAAQVLNAGIIGKVYLNSIHLFQLRCEPEEMWLDPSRGVFCRGPPGPEPRLSWGYFGNEKLPLTTELVQEDVLLRFLASLQSKDIDDVVVSGVVASSDAWIGVPEPVLRPTVISTVTNAPLAITSKLLYRHALLVGYTSNSDTCRRIQQPIYLFIRSTLPDFDDGETSSLHYWSFDEDGHSTLPDNLCNNFGLPTTLRLLQLFESRSWSNDAYSCLRQYQLLRGFDPSATDFARSLGYDQNIFHPLSDSDQFAQVNQGSFHPSPLIAVHTSQQRKISLQLTHLDLFTASGPPQPISLDTQKLVIMVPSPWTRIDLSTSKKADPECEPPTSTTSKTSAGGAQSTELSSALLSPLSSTLLDDSDILAIGF